MTYPSIRNGASDQMENSRVKDVLEQIRFSAIEIAHGCAWVAEIGATKKEVGMLELALREMHAAAEGLHKSMAIDKELDHDGDTQPENEKPEPPPDDRAVLLPEPASFAERYDEEPPWMRDRSPCGECGHERDVHGPAARVDGRTAPLPDPKSLTDEELVAEAREIYGLPAWERGFPLTAKSRGEIERSIEAAEIIGQRRPRVPSLVCHVVDCSCRAFSAKTEA